MLVSVAEQVVLVHIRIRSPVSNFQSLFRRVYQLRAMSVMLTVYELPAAGLDGRWYAVLWLALS